MGKIWSKLNFNFLQQDVARRWKRRRLASAVPDDSWRKSMNSGIRIRIIHFYSMPETSTKERFGKWTQVSISKMTSHHSGISEIFYLPYLLRFKKILSRQARREIFWKYLHLCEVIRMTISSCFYRVIFFKLLKN